MKSKLCLGLFLMMAIFMGPMCAGAPGTPSKEEKLTKKVGASRVRLLQDQTGVDVVEPKQTKKQIKKAKNSKTTELTLSQNSPVLTALTLDQAVSAAYKHKPDLQALKYQIQRAKLGEKDAWTGYYPRIGATGTISDDLSGSQYSNVGFNVKQLVYDFAGPQETAKIAKTNTALVKLQERVAQNNIRWQVENSYLSCWLLQQQREAVSLLGKSSRVTYDKAVNANKVQLLDKKDWLASAESHAGDISTVYKYDDQVLISQKMLEYLMGYSLNLNIGSAIKSDVKNAKTTTLNWDYEQDITLKPLDYYVNAARKYRPEIRIGEKLVELRQNEYSKVTKTRLPRFDVGASVNHIVGHGLADSYETVPKSDYSCSGSVTWNIFDGFHTEYEAQKLQAYKTEEMLKKQETVQLVKNGVETAYHTVSQKVTDLAAEKFKYVRAKNDFELAKQNFDIGIISKVEFESAKTTWEEAQNSWLAKRVDVELKYRDLAYACGYFSELNA